MDYILYYTILSLYDDCFNILGDEDLCNLGGDDLICYIIIK
jgi:hypothetical protein